MNIRCSKTNIFIILVLQHIQLKAFVKCFSSFSFYVSSLAPFLFFHKIELHFYNYYIDYNWHSQWIYADLYRYMNISSAVIKCDLKENPYLNADKHSPASSVRSTKRRVRRDAYVSRSLQLPLTDHGAAGRMKNYCQKSENFWKRTRLLFGWKTGLFFYYTL